MRGQVELRAWTSEDGKLRTLVRGEYEEDLLVAFVALLSSVVGSDTGIDWPLIESIARRATTDPPPKPTRTVRRRSQPS